MDNIGQIALSFFPLSTQNFEFTVYRRMFLSGERKGDLPDCYLRPLPKQPSSLNSKSEYSSYWISFTPREGFELYSCTPHENPYLTNDYLFYLLKTVCSQNLSPEEYKLSRGMNKRRVSFLLEQFPEGHQVVWLEPYYLKCEGKFGFLADFKFDSEIETKPSRRTLQLSLSLDKDAKSNRNYYVDRYEKIQLFVSRYHLHIFRLAPDFSITKSLCRLNAESLVVSPIRN